MEIPEKVQDYRVALGDFIRAVIDEDQAITGTGPVNLVAAVGRTREAGIKLERATAALFQEAEV